MSAVCRRVVALLGAVLLIAGPGAVAPAAAHTQCAPYARAVSGIDLYGAAGGWWQQAAGLYARGHAPQVGSVLAFRASHAMPSGHVAVVRAVVDSRHVLLDHANWSHPGAIEHAALAEDVSAEGDWSAVRVWYAPINGLGLRAVPAYGFIYHHGPADALTSGAAARAEPGSAIASADHINIPASEPARR